ncbi:SDR family oxidoreductase [Dyella sp. S184]|uniref:SDR family NAD(P)-dependent oxidoreductase n=1 Tax=Dyella sp. S184 TaxID=1641862 RepID=UPI00131C750B|nr:SDR family oxidoreductase [Dyella sp. S184]
MKTFLVTGAASGIGAQLAAALLQRGERVCAVDINPAPMEALKAAAATPEQLWIASLDVRDAAAWDALLDQLKQRWSQLDVLVNVAGVLKPGYCHESTAAEVDFHIDINTKGTIHGTRAAARLMKAQGHGHIVNIASLAGIAAIPGLSLYSASKFAVRGYTLAVAQELRDTGVKVTVVCPDAVQTPMLDLQVNYDQAALTFSGNRSLTTQEVVSAILDHALTKAPLEITLPASRGFVSKLASFFPGLSALVLEGLLKKGRQKQQQAKQP